MRTATRLTRTGLRWPQVAITLLMAFLLVSCADRSRSASADGDGPRLEGRNVVYYDGPLYKRVQFEESYRIIREGDRRPDGSCTFVRSTTLRPTDPPRQQMVIEVELAFDPDTCRSLVEIGAPKRR